MKFNKLNVTLNTTIAISAIVTMFLSFWESYNTRLHNRMSVRPILQFRSNYDNKTGLMISNDGNGVAIIKSSEIFFNGQSFGQMSLINWSNLLKNIGIKEEKNIEYGGFVHGISIPYSSQVYPVIMQENQTDIQWHEWHQAINNIKVEICYCSIYEECWLAKWEHEDVITNEPRNCNY